MFFLHSYWAYLISGLYTHYIVWIHNHPHTLELHTTHHRGADLTQSPSTQHNVLLHYGISTFGCFLVEIRSRQADIQYGCTCKEKNVCAIPTYDFSFHGLETHYHAVSWQLIFQFGFAEKSHFHIKLAGQLLHLGLSINCPWGNLAELNSTKKS